MSHLITLQKQLMLFKPKDAVDHANLGLFDEFISESKDVFDRYNYEFGHVTSGGFVVNKERTHCILMHHKKLKKWIQMGGHIEGNISPVDSAFKEVSEETGMQSIVNTGKVHDIGVHIFPEKADKSQPEHMHYDVCFLFEADLNEQPKKNEESHDVKWLTLEDAYNLGDETVKRMITRLKS